MAGLVFLLTAGGVIATYVPGGPRVCRDQLTATGSLVDVCQPVGVADAILIGLVLFVAVLFLLPDISEFGIAGLLSMKLRRRIVETERKVEEAEVKTDQLQAEVAEVKALSDQDQRISILVDMALESAARPSRRDLAAALKGASLAARLAALKVTIEHRRRLHQKAEGTTDPKRRASYQRVMARCLPVLAELAKLDWSEAGDPTILRRIHAQLGFALKDSDRPLWGRAAEELSIAIGLRDGAGGKSMLLETNRAKCLVNCRPDDVDPILRDLESIIRDGTFTIEIFKDPILPWLKGHGDNPRVTGWRRKHASELD